MEPSTAETTPETTSAQTFKPTAFVDRNHLEISKFFQNASQAFEERCEPIHIDEEDDDSLAVDILLDYSFFEVRSLEDWASLIFTFTLPNVKKMINGDRPRFVDIPEVSWGVIKEAGVYSHLCRGIQDHNHAHLYIGAASRERGLAGRRKQHQRELDKGPDEKQANSIHYNVFRNLGRQTDAIHTEVRVLCYLAEAVFAGILGAYAPGAGPELNEICPFGTNLPWWGLCLHSPLTDGVGTAYSAERSAGRTRESKKLYFASFYPDYKARLIRVDMDRLANNTRVYRKRLNADEEKRKTHLERRKVLQD
ncbi:hypothetical protein NHQ30_004308 [Ciborinia camelliae]|nr:hypothetical protein NHQ30_004308 [Ciborinia camelliae]